MTDVVAALIWRNDRFLACQRPAHKARGLLWEFVGGKVEKGETLKEALVRECREELDVTVGVGEIFMEVIHEYPDLSVRLSLFNSYIIEGEPQRLEHNDIRWIKTSEIDGMCFCPADEDILTVLRNIDNRLQAQLYALRDKSYHKFNSSLIPSISYESIIGVRMPQLRKIAKSLSGVEQLGKLPHRYYEENCLHGLLINRISGFDDTIDALNKFLPYVDNWAVCDLLSPKSFRHHPTGLLDYVRLWIKSDHTYTVRFGIGVLMKFYLDDAYQTEYLSLVASINHDDYYVKMMIAWYFATALAKQYETAIKILQDRKLSGWCHNKTIQKACESYRISKEQKAYLRTLKTEKVGLL